MSDQTILENREAMRKLDQSNLLGGVETLADQIINAWSQTQALSLTLPTDIQNVVVAGMGGSGLGTHLVTTLFRDRISVPILQVQDYTLPGWADEHTLVLATSFSGGTEEIVSCVEHALDKKAQVAIVTGGGKLLEIAQEHNLPLYQMNPTKNPSSETRIALGYSIFGLIGFMVKLGLLDVSKTEIDELVASVIQQSEACSPESPQTENPAKTLAFELLDRRPILVGADHLVGALHTATNQLNENAKVLAEYREVPEMNHHLMEGFSFPKSIHTSNMLVIFRSKLYHPQNQKRIEITAETAENNELDTLIIDVTNSTHLTQVGEVMTLLNYASFYLCMLEGINPGPIPNVEWFKSELKQR